jgi:uncharacterized protein with NRDE domain
MCLILFACRATSAFPFVLAANRDEFRRRPTHKAHWWRDYPDVLGGLDLEAGGAWLGVSTSGRFAALTNVRDLRNLRNDAPSRGELTRAYLTGQYADDEFAAFLQREGAAYNGFNILWGNISPNVSGAPHLWHYSNYDAARGVTPIADGVHGLSNAFLNTPWPKVKRGKAALRAALNGAEQEEETQRKTQEENSMEALGTRLLAALRNDERAPDAELPDTGVGLEWERQLSPMFIDAPERDYGTRCSTVLVVARDGRAFWTERRYTPAFDGDILENASAMRDGVERFTFAPPTV